MNDIMRELQSSFAARKISLTYRETGAVQLLQCTAAGATLKRIPVSFICANGKRDLSILSPRFAVFTSETREQALELAIRLHLKYRYIRFIVEDDDSVTARLDIPASCTSTSKVAFEYFVRLVTILDRAYAELPDHARPQGGMNGR